MKIKQEHECFVLQGEKWKSLRYADIDPSSLVVYRQEGETRRVFPAQAYEYRDGKIRRAKGSPIPDFSASPFYDLKGFDHEKFSAWGNEPYMLFADYECCAAAEQTPEFRARELSRKNGMAGRLEKFFGARSGGEIRYTVFGDSISTGCEASIPQYTFFERFSRYAAQKFGVSVPIENVAVGGESTFEGVRRYRRDVLASRPAIVSIGFGMNDQNTIGGKLTVPPDDYYKNILEITCAVQDTGAQAVLISPCCPHPRWIHTSGRMDDYVAKLYEVSDRTGACLADVNALWKDELQYKQPDDLLRNGINHPTDYGHYLYFLMLKNLID